MRRPDWSERLIATLIRHQAQPFGWGGSDCATLFADAVEAVTGVDPLAEWRPWADRTAAERALVRSGYRSVAELVVDRFPEITPATAQRGDIGFTIEFHRLMSPAVVVGSEAVSRDQKGWIVFPRTELVRAFKVG